MNVGEMNYEELCNEATFLFYRDGVFRTGTDYPGALPFFEGVRQSAARFSEFYERRMYGWMVALATLAVLSLVRMAYPFSQANYNLHLGVLLLAGVITAVMMFRSYIRHAHMEWMETEAQVYIDTIE